MTSIQLQRPVPLIALFSDFGLEGPYVGLMRAALVGAGAPVIDLMHDAPRFEPQASGWLLGALGARLPAGAVVVGVVDPGVGTAERQPVIVEAEQRWYVGPGNGLFNRVAAAAGGGRWWRIDEFPEPLSASFHGRDLFAPTAARLAAGRTVKATPLPPPPLADAEYARVLYIDAFGNAMIGLAPRGRDAVLSVGARRLGWARTFGDVAPGQAFWYENSLGLVEVAVNRGSAAAQLGLGPGSEVAWAE